MIATWTFSLSNIRGRGLVRCRDPIHRILERVPSTSDLERHDLDPARATCTKITSITPSRTGPLDARPILSPHFRHVLFALCASRIQLETVFRKASSMHTAPPLPFSLPVRCLVPPSSYMSIRETAPKIITDELEKNNSILENISLKEAQ